MGKTKRAAEVAELLDTNGLQPENFSKTASKAKKYVPDEEEINGHIRKCAYYKWQNAGYPDGQQDQFWVEAEQEIRSKL